MAQDPPVADEEQGERHWHRRAPQVLSALPVAASLPHLYITGGAKVLDSCRKADNSACHACVYAKAAGL